MPSVEESIVLIGGGHGTEQLVIDLRPIRTDLTAILTVFDSGGHTGKIRERERVVGWGDLRRVIASAVPEQNIVFRQLLQHRFTSDNTALGNDIIRAFYEIYHRDLMAAIEEVCRIGQVKVKVLPISLHNVDLCVELDDKSIIRGEGLIDKRSIHDARKIMGAFLDPPADINTEAYKRIVNAQKIVLGPGSLYTSIVPNFLVSGFQEAINKTKGQVIYVVNLMTDPTETRGYVASDFVRVVSECIGREIDVVLVNNGEISRSISDQYRKNGLVKVKADINEIQKYCRTVVSGDYVQEIEEITSDGARVVRVRHDLSASQTIANLPSLE